MESLNLVWWRLQGLGNCEPVDKVVNIDSRKKIKLYYLGFQA